MKVYNGRNYIITICIYEHLLKSSSGLFLFFYCSGQADVRIAQSWYNLDGREIVTGINIFIMQAEKFCRQTFAHTESFYMRS